MLWSMRKYECLLLILEATQNDSGCLAKVVSLNQELSSKLYLKPLSEKKVDELAVSEKIEQNK